MKKHYIGLMSGTSMDAVDAALVDFSDIKPKLVATHKTHLSPELRVALNRLCATDTIKITELVELDVKMAHAFVDATLKLLAKTAFSASDIIAIGSHGQTIFHCPQSACPSSTQIGDPNIIAEKTGITTVADFRRRDIAAGGQGAPLTPAFHNFIFRSEKEDRIVLNLGGIANITYLPVNTKIPVIGFDTGPANLLMDKWIYAQRQLWYDADGNWAASTPFDEALLEQFLSDSYFGLSPPKSTGYDYFNLNWIKSQIAQLGKDLTPATVQATLCELTAVSIGMAVQQLNSDHGAILLCGGGSKNSFLKKRLAKHCPKHVLDLTDSLHFPGEWIEAMAFAWFAQQTCEGKTSNLPEVTGAKNFTVLGGIYLKN